LSLLAAGLSRDAAQLTQHRPPLCIDGIAPFASEPTAAQKVVEANVLPFKQ